MPSKSRKQQAYMGMQLAKKRAGQATDVDMTESQLKDFASTPHKGLPAQVKAVPVPVQVAVAVPVKVAGAPKGKPKAKREKWEPKGW
jgi:hypothetical protein